VNILERSPVITIANMEFTVLARQPLIWIICIVIVLLSFVHAAGNMVLLPQWILDGSSEVFISGAMNNSFWYTTLFCSLLAMGIGITSISEERSNGNIRVLLSKPMYRRDLIAGKFLGASAFLLVAVSMALVLCVVTTLLVFNGPVSLSDLAVRMSCYGIVLFLYCVLTLGIAMLIGAYFKELALALIFAFSYMYFGWILCYYFDYFKGTISSLKLLDPYRLYCGIVFESGIGIFNVSIPVVTWFNSVSLEIGFLILEIIVIFLANCIVFNKEES